MSGSILTRKRVVAAKIETTPGTAEALTASDAAFNVFDMTIQPDVPFEQRQGQGGFSDLPGVPGARAANVEFAVELCGSGNVGSPVPAWASTFLPACGFVESASVFSPQSQAPGVGSSGTQTLTIGFYEDGKKKVARGCMGTFVIRLTSGGIIRLEFKFRGVWDSDADVTILAPTYPTVAPLRFAGDTITIGSWSPKIAAMTIDVGNELKLREDPTTVAAYLSALIVDRRITGTLDPEAELVADNDVIGDWLDRSEAALAIALGAASADGNKVDVAAPAFQITNVQEADRDGLQTDNVEFQLNRSAAAGDNELTITFS